MSGDIFAVVEYDERGEPPFGTDSYPESLSSGTFYLERSYYVFAALAGVRSEDGFEPLIPPRGLPPRFSSAVEDQLFLSVLAEDEEDWRESGAVPRIDADRMVAEQGAVYIDTPLKEKAFVSDPQYHSMSWLTLEELRAALRHAGIAHSELPTVFRITIETMEVVERVLGEGRSRLVFWFEG